jgi:hypothetical protein
MHRTTRRIGALAATVVATTFAMGCSAAAPEDASAASDEEAIVSQDTISLTADDLEDAMISETGITFFSPSDKVYNLRQGNIVTGVRGDVPFIRRVRRIDTGMDGTVVVVGESEEFLKAAPTVRTSKKVTMKPAGVDKSGVTLAQGKGIQVVCSSCFVRYTPSFEFSLETKLGEVQKVGVAFDGDLESELDLRVEASGGGGSITKEVELGSVQQRFVQMVGPIPMWEDLSVKLVAGVEGTVDADAKIETALKATKSMKASVTYEQGKQWHFDKGSDGSFTFEQPVLKTKLGASATAYLKLRLEASVYSIAKAFIDGEARGTASAVVCPSPGAWSFDGKLGLNAGVSLTIPGFEPLEKDWELWSAEKKSKAPIASLGAVKCP